MSEDPKTAPELVWAPWTAEQVERLRRYQELGVFHPFTCPCGCGGVLVPRADGWLCPETRRVVQDWCHAFMCDGAAERAARFFDPTLGEPHA